MQPVAEKSALDMLADEITAEEYRPDEERVNNAWACVTDEYKKSGGTKKQLFKKANVGFTAEPTGYKRFINDPAVSELQEKLEFAYSDPKYYHCLAENDFPVPFAMNDFDPATFPDDQLRFEIDSSVDKLKDEVSKDKDDDSLTRKIYDWSLKAFKYNGDCKIEAADHSAIMQRCGACTESSVAMFYAYRRAGLKPQLFYWHDLKPSLEWIDMLPKLGQAMDHIFIGIPQKDGSFLHVDRIRNIFDAKYEFAVPISPRHFVSEIWLNNKRNDLDKLRRYGESEQIDKAIISIAPESFASYFSLLTLYRGQGRQTDYSALLQTVQKRFSDHPWAMFLSTYIDLEKQVAEAREAGVSPRSVQQKVEESNEKLNRLGIELEKQSPNLAAQLNYYFARSLLQLFVPALNSYRAAKGSGVNINDKEASQFEQMKKKIFFHYAESIALDPNYLFAFKDIDALLTETASHEEAVGIYGKLLEKYPDHPPLIYGLSEFLIFWANSSTENRQAKLEKAIELTNRLMALEPEHPKPYFLQGMAHFTMNKFDKTADVLGKSIVLYKKRNESVPKEAYAMLVYVYLFLADKNSAEKAIEMAFRDHPLEAAGFISAQFLNTFKWIYSTNTRSNIIEDGVANITDGDAMNFQKFRDIFQAGDFIFDKISNGSEAEENISAVRAYALLYLSLFGGIETAGTWFAKIRNKDSQKVQAGFARGLEQMAGVLLNVKLVPTKDQIDGLCEVSGLIEDALSDEHKDALLKMKAGLYRSYVLLEDRAKAEELLRESIAGGSPFSLMPLMVIEDLFENGGGTEKNTRRLILAMDLVYNRLSSFMPEIKEKIGMGYKRLAELCSQNAMIEEAEAALKRSRGLNFEP